MQAAAPRLRMAAQTPRTAAALLGAYPLWGGLLGARGALVEAAGALATTSGRIAAPWGQWRHAHTSSASGAASGDRNRASAVPALPAAVSLLPDGGMHQPELLLDGSRMADPGEPRYTAPYWVPQPARQAHRLPPVLFTDPWHPAGEAELRRKHARLCLEHLKRAGRPLTAQDIMEGVQREAGAPVFGSLAYVRSLMENLRRGRIVFGKKNPASEVAHGLPTHPRLYTPLPYQQAKMGLPEQLAKAAEALRERRVADALKRLKNSKPPFPIYRRRATFSVVQHGLAEEQMRLAMRPAQG